MFGPTDPEPDCRWQTPFRFAQHLAVFFRFFFGWIFVHTPHLKFRLQPRNHRFQRRNFFFLAFPFFFRDFHEGFWLFSRHSSSVVAAGCFCWISMSRETATSLLRGSLWKRTLPKFQDILKMNEIDTFLKFGTFWRWIDICIYFKPELFNAKQVNQELLDNQPQKHPPKANNEAFHAIHSYSLPIAAGRVP